MDFENGPKPDVCQPYIERLLFILRDGRVRENGNLANDSGTL